MAGNAVLRMVPSSVCMKKAMATIQGSRRAVRGSSDGRLVCMRRPAVVSGDNLYAIIAGYALVRRQRRK